VWLVVINYIRNSGVVKIKLTGKNVHAGVVSHDSEFSQYAKAQPTGIGIGVLDFNIKELIR